MSETVEEIAHFPGVAEANDRRARFVRLAESRTAKAMKAIRVIGNWATGRSMNSTSAM